MKIPLLLLSACILYGCSSVLQCGNPVIQLRFVGFKKSDVDTIILRRYNTGNNFQNLIDTLIQVSDTSILFQSNDTIALYSFSNDGIKYGNDWKIFIPEKNRTISISKINSEQTSIDCPHLLMDSKCDCVNTIHSLQLDSTQIDLSDINNSQENYHVYIH